MSRLPDIPEAALSAAQRALVDRLLAGPRKRVSGPFKVLLNSPGLLDGVERLGTYVRYGSTLPPPIKEMVVLVVARHWRCAYEWEAHLRHALAAGVPESLAAAIATDKRPDGLSREQAAAYDLVRSLLANGHADDDVYAAASGSFRTDQLVDLVGTIGYYTAIAMTLNAFRVPQGGVPSIAIPVGPNG